jgi:transcriptional regulator with XRE-family HTH domain
MLYWAAVPEAVLNESCILLVCAQCLVIMNENETKSAGVAKAPPSVEQLVNELCSECDLKQVSSEQFGEKIEQLRKLLNISPTDFAKQCHISIATYYRWAQGKGGKPPRHRVEQFYDFLDARASAANATEENVHEAIREFRDLHDRQWICKRQWALKTILPFRAAKDELIKRNLTKLLVRDNEADFNCVFYAGEDGPKSRVSKWAAKHSFIQYKRALRNESPDAASRIRGWWIRDEELAFELGLGTLDYGLTILEYDAQRRAESAISSIAGREVDYFFEIPVAVYPKEEDSRTNTVEDIRWIEWPSSRSSQDWLHRKTLLEGIVKGKHRKVEQVLGTSDDFSTTIPLDYPG